MPYTTFAKLHEHGACVERYCFLAQKLGGIPKYGKDTPIAFDRLLELNGLDDTLWALRATTEPCDKLARLFACDCAERVLPIFENKYPEDKRPRQAVEVARRFASGQATDSDRAAAWTAARDAELEWQQKHLLQMLQAEDTEVAR